MRLTTRGRYAVNAMLNLALHSGNKKPLPLVTIAKQNNISVAYLEQLFFKLKKNNLIQSVRGINGGYYLNFSASNITITDIIKSVEENIDITYCKGKRNCNRGAECISHKFWTEVTEQLYTHMGNINLQQIINKYKLNSSIKKYE